MKKILMLALTACLALGAGGVYASQAEDIQTLQKYFKKLFPKVKFAEYANGPYALDMAKRVNWESQRDFPPFLDYLDEGEDIWDKKFKNGKGFATCFGKDASKIRTRYPRWDAKSKKVQTLESAILACQKANGEKPFKKKKGKLVYLSAWIASQANGQKINVIVPNDPGAIAAYEAGKKFFFAKRGQLNFSCADCHIYNAGKRIRGNLMSAVIGHNTHMPVWRGKWAKKSKTGDGFGSLHRRYGGCNKQIRAHPFKAQGKDYSNLEYFETSLSNGLVIDAPDYRE